MTDAPERIWLQTAGEWAGASEVTWCELPVNDGDHEYIRADLASPSDPLAAALARPEVRALVEAAQWARNRLELIADQSWHGDGRDLKRSIIGVFADFDKALLACGSSVPAALASLGGQPAHGTGREGK
jgi:hypothetical protein